jgi:ribosome-associated toxin RatA of RatAB toxin-antitoxin module
MRRWLVILAALLLPLAAQAEDSYVRSVSVVRDKGGYACDVVLYAPVPVGLAFDVLSDVDHMVDWVPNLRQSRVLRREGNVAIIEQVGLAQFGFLSFTFTTERRLELERPVSIRATQIRGDARRYNSFLRFEPDGAGTRIQYHAEFEPGILAGLVLDAEFFEHEIREQFTAMIREMVRRQASATLTPGPSPKGEGSPR